MPAPNSPRSRHRRSHSPGTPLLLGALLALGACGNGLGNSAGGGTDDGSAGSGDGGGAPGPCPVPDAPVPADAHYVAPDGNDSADGSRSHPWRTLAHAFAAIAAGDTLVLRSGTWFEHHLRLTATGTATAPIMVRNAPGEDAVLDAGYPQFRSATNQDWEPYDVGRGVYRSVATFAGAGQVFGHLGEHAGGHRLVPYERYQALAADGEDYSASSDFYVGPGVYWSSSDQRIYIRLQASRYHAILNCGPAADADPRRAPMVLWPSRPLLDLRATTAWTEFRGLSLVHGEAIADAPSGCSHLTFRSCELQGGRYSVIVRGGAHDLLFDGVTFDGRFPAYVARSDVKMPENAPPAHLMQDAAIDLEGAVAGIEIANCRFTRLFDAIDSTGAIGDIEVHHCEFTEIRDDAFEIATEGRRIEFHHNTVRRAAAGVSRNGSHAPSSVDAGTKFVHHNVIDTSVLQLYGRNDPLHLLPPRWRGPAGDGMASGPAFSGHQTENLDGPDPWRIYYNTIVGAEDVDLEGFGLGYRHAPFRADVPHAVLDNVFIQHGDQWIVRGARVADGSQVFDGNVYHRPRQNPTTMLLAEFVGGGTASYPSLVAFMTSAQWLATRSHHPPGWESLGEESDPQLDERYRPAATSPAAQPGIDLSARGWPDAELLPYRGAVAPRRRP